MKTDEQRSHWDSKYQQGLPSLEKPDPFFVSAFQQFVADQFPEGGVALDLAGGIGRHALWLADRNWQVTVVDISDVAILKLAEKAKELDLTLNLCALDASTHQFENASFDLIVMFYHCDRDICARLLTALRPGGFLICKSSLALTPYQGAAMPNLRPLEKSEILALLPTLQVMIHNERPARDRGVVEFIGRKCNDG